MYCIKTYIDTSNTLNNNGLRQTCLHEFKATLLEPYWDTAGTLLEPGEPLLERGETLLELRWNLVAGTFGWNILLGTNAGVHFVFLFALFLALLNVPGCEVGSLA